MARDHFDTFGPQHYFGDDVDDTPRPIITIDATHSSYTDIEGVGISFSGRVVINGIEYTLSGDDSTNEEGIYVTDHAGRRESLIDLLNKIINDAGLDDLKPYMFLDILAAISEQHKVEFLSDFTMHYVHEFLGLVPGGTKQTGKQ